MTEPKDDAATQPVYERFDSEAQLQAAIDRILAQQGRELRIFDPDMASLRLNTPARIARLDAFLGASRTRRLYLALHDGDHLARFCPRMLSLIARYAHAVQVQRTVEEIRNLQDSFIVVDATHYLRRPVARLARGALGLHDETEALAMRSRFMEIWSASTPDLPPTTVGL